MLEMVVLAAACVCCAVFYLIFLLLFLVRRLNNRWLWSKSLKLVRPILRELYANDLADGANLAIQAQPDEIRLEPRPDHAWKDPEKVGNLTASLERLGFAGAGIFAIDKLPDFHLRLMANENMAAAAAIYEHPGAGVWLDIVSNRSNGDSLTYTTSRDPGLPGHMRPPFSSMNYRPGTGAEALYREFLSARGPDKYRGVSMASIAGQFERAWAKDVEWRKKAEAAMLPEEAHAFKEGRPMPDEKNRREKRKFDLWYGIAGILNFAALVTLLFAVRGYDTVGDGPLVAALWHTLPPLAVFAWFFAGSVQTDGPISKFMAWTIMAIISFPFIFGTVWLGEVYLNCAKDPNPPTVRSAAVLDKTHTKRTRRRSYYLRVKAWNQGRETERLRVTEAQYARVRPGYTIAKVTTKPGFLGYEWIAGLRFEK